MTCMAKKKRITLNDISQATGFSITTISHVINRTRHVDPGTRRTILNAVEEMGYSQQKRSSSANPLILGMVLADIRVDYFYEIAKETEDIARNLGYDLLFCDSEESPETEEDCINMLLRSGVAGLIIAPSHTGSDYRQLLDSRKLPVVLIDRNWDHHGHDFVGIDDYKSAHQAVRRLLDRGLRKIALIGCMDYNYTVRERKGGYRAALLEAGCYDETRVLQLEFHREAMKNDITEFLESSPDLEGILCLSSNICYETIHCLEELGRDGSEGPEVISYDDNKWFDQIRYPVTSIRQPTGEIAQVAMELLADKLHHRNSRGIPKQILLEYEFIRHHKEERDEPIQGS